MRASRIEQLDASDDVKAYLRKVAKESQRIFSRGHVSAPTATSQCAPQNALPHPPPNPLSFVPRLPMKRQRRGACESDDDDDENRPAGVTHAAPQKQEASVTAVTPAAASNTAPPRVNLVSQWFAMTSATSLVLPHQALPPEDFVNQCVLRFAAVRERVVQARIVTEMLSELQNSAKRSATTTKQREQLLALLSRHFPPLRQQARSVGRDKESDRVKALEKQVLGVVVPETADAKQWYRYTEGPEGPLHAPGPTLSLVSRLDQARSSTLLHVIVNKLQRGARDDDGTSEAAARNAESDSSCSDAEDDGDAVCEGKLFINDDDDNDAQNQADSEHDAEPKPTTVLPSNINTETPPLDERLTLHAKELMRFLRHLLPCQLASGHVTGGYGGWLYIMLASIELVVDGDTDRTLHNLFRSLCQHIKTVWEHFAPAVAPADSERGALFRHMNSRCQCDAPKVYARVDDVGLSELSALYALAVVLAKVFRQNQSHLLAI